MRRGNFFSYSQRAVILCCQQTVQLVVLGLCLLLTQQVTYAQPASTSALDWLKRMQNALHSLNYEGRFVHQTGTQIQSMHVVHRVDHQQKLEHLTALDGEPREVIRSNDHVVFIRSGEHLINTKTLPQQTTLHRKHPLKKRELAENYQLKLGEKSRVAGRTVQMIEIIPQDNLRYGHRLYLDQMTALPLRSAVFNIEGELLTQSLFVDLQTGQGIREIEYDIASLSSKKSKFDRCISAKAHQQRWFFSRLPTGYTQTAYRYYSQQQQEHFTFSDGLNMVSLYIEPLHSSPLIGHSSMGATTTLALEKHAQQIMLMGEVPMQVLHKIAQALQSHD